MKRTTLTICILCLCAVMACNRSTGSSAASGPRPKLSPGLFLKTIGQMQKGRSGAIVVTLASGKVLIAGGGNNIGGSLASAEVYDPADGSFSAVENTLSSERYRAAGCLLADGRVLIVGGEDKNSKDLATADIYDPATNRFSPTAGDMMIPRYLHTVTLLTDGTVLVAGGFQATVPPEGSLDSAETFDPATGLFTPTAGLMTNTRTDHAAVRLIDGMVLIAGGDTAAAILDTAELYDPATRTFGATTGNMTSQRAYPKGTLLADGRVLLSGGTILGATLDSAELYDPATQTFAATANNMGSERLEHFSVLLADGRVLVGGGFTFFGFLTPTVSADLFDPATNTFSPAANLKMARGYAPAVLLADGRVLVVGGSDNGDLSLVNAELYNPSADTFSVTGGMTTSRAYASAAALPDGSVLIAGGVDDSNAPLANAEVFDPNTSQSLRTTGPMGQFRVDFTMATLPNGKILVTGGTFDNAQAEIYDPATRIFTPTAGIMNSIRVGHTATTLRDGTVLLVGGVSDFGQPPLNSAELYDPDSDTFIPIADTLITARVSHAAALMSDGHVLIVGGTGDGEYSGALDSAEIYNPVSQTFANTGALSVARIGHTATALPGGQVLVVGGLQGDLTVHDTAEIYIRSHDGFSEVDGIMQNPRFAHTATVLDNDLVLVAGGWTFLDPTLLAPLFCSGSADLYDPITMTFISAAPMVDRRANHTTTSLDNGLVLLAGGSFDVSGATWMLASTEFFIP